MNAALRVSGHRVESERSMEHSLRDEAPNLGERTGQRKQASIEVLTLKECVLKYRKSFPLRVRIVEGEYSDDPDESLSSGDVYWLHSVKGTASILIKGGRGSDSMQLTVPATNSSIEYGLVDNSAGTEHEEELLKGSVYKTVRELMAAKPMPKVVCATRSHHTSKADCSSVSESEILVIQGVKRVKLFELRLHAYSVTEGVAKVLAADCHADFSTKPALAKVNMRVLLQHVRVDFPVAACAFASAAEDVRALGELRNRVVVLQAIVEGAQCVLATNYEPERKPAFVLSPSDYLHLPIDLRITVSLYREEDDTCTSSAAEEAGVDGTAIAGRARQLSEEPPDAVRSDPEKTSHDEDEDYHRVTTIMSLQEDLKLEFARSMKEIALVPDACGSPKEIHYAPLTIFTKQQSETSHYDAPNRNALTHQQETSHYDTPSYKALTRKNVTETDNVSKPEIPRVKLDGLTVEQVCDLLASLGMVQHCSTFLRENINGSVLLYCTEDVLRDELKISSAEQRKILLSIIEKNN